MKKRSKNKKKKLPIKIVSSVLYTLFFLVVFFIGMDVAFSAMSIRDGTEVAGCIVTMVSFVISCIAVVITMCTYFSIDSLYLITSMDGNVLENPIYSVPYVYNVKQLNACMSADAYDEKLIEIIGMNGKKRTQTCIEYAEWIQTVVDNLVWFAYCNKTDASLSKRLDKISRILDKERDRYQTLSNRTLYVIEDNVKLIKCVFSYQKKVQIHQWGEDDDCSFEDIRGQMLTNRATQVVCYNYLGLDCMNKAINKMTYPSNYERFSKDFLACFNEHGVRNKGECKEENWKVSMIYLDRAEKSLEQARKAAETDIYWEGYIQYNIVRVRILQSLMKQELFMKDSILEEFNEVIRIRENIYLLMENREGYLASKFMEELDLAKGKKDSYLEFLET